MSPTARDALCVDLREFHAHPGRQLPFAAREEAVEIALGGGMSLEGELRFEGSAWAQLGILYATGRIAATLVRHCRRCLREIRTPVTLDESLEIMLDPTAEAVDLAPHLLGAVAAVYDPLVLCRDDCRGLCPRCGTDRNDDPEHDCGGDGGEPARRLGELLR
ncbi:MAG: hypothetical protein JSW65_03325 [Candidatus Bipolaricaulota bacterium]|nr:MAG: hypothetical protein JSW65_03325 [Candidatus Bipolaricaulota bacterium]